MKNDTSYQPKLSASGKITVALGLAFLSNVAMAANIEAIGSTKVRQKNSVDIVNIAAPNAQGLSHNQYNKFNVSKHGAVLNNALTAGNSQLAGSLTANTNLRGQAASVILNEVVSKNPSLILGRQEIFGIAADYILANPNGITHNGGSILNANRASLVVGKPVVSDGQLQSFDVGGSSKLQVNGSLDGNQVVDLIAPQVVIGKTAKVKAADTVTVVSGAAGVDYRTGRVEAVEPAAKAPVLDGQIFGSMRAGTIRIHATDKRAKQTIQNADIAGTRRLNIESSGDLSVQSSKLSGAQITLGAKNTDIKGTVGHHSANKSTSGKEAQNVFAFRANRDKTETFSASSINASGTLTLNNTGNVNLDAANIEAGALNISAAGNVNAKAVKTTNRKENDYTRSKGAWYNNSLESSTDETLHQTKIQASAVNIETDGRLHLDASELTSLGDARIAAKKGILLSSNSETDKESTYVSFKNETAALKTGTATKATETSTARRAKLTAGGDLGLVSDSDLTTYGASISANGNLITDVNNINLGTQITADTDNLDDQKKYWGGLFGADSKAHSKRTETLHGSDVSSGTNVVLGAKKGVNIYGSTVKGQVGTFVTAEAGNIDIRHATSTDTSVQSARKGTIFNITTSKTSSNSAIEKVTGSTLESKADLVVVSNKDINVIGSALTAAQKLQLISAGNLTIAAAKSEEKKQTSEYSIKGYATTETDEANGSVTAKAGIKFTDAKTDSEATGINGSVATGKNTELASQSDIAVSGSQINGEESVRIDADGNVNILAEKGGSKVQESGRVTDLGVSATVFQKDNAAGLSISGGITSTKTDALTVTNASQVSNINSGGDITIVAKGNITQEGTLINAGGNVVESAASVKHTAAQNSTQSDVKQSSGGISVTAGVSTNKGIGGELSIHGQGGNTSNSATNATVTTINAGNAVIAAKDSVSDEGTQYNATGAVGIDTGNYHNTVAHNTTSSTNKQGGAALTIGAYTNDGSNIDVNANLNVNYSDESKQTSNAVKGNMNATDVVINAKENATIASNITAANNINITAGKEANFTESADTSSTQGTSVNVGLGVGAKVNVETGVAVPKVNALVAVNTSDNSSVTATGAEIGANNAVNITANNGNVNLQGTNVVSGETVAISGNQVNTNGSSSVVNEKGITVNANVGYADNKLNGSANANGKNQSNVTHTANNISSDNVVITTAKPDGLKTGNTAVTGNNVSVYYVGNHSTNINKPRRHRQAPATAKRRYY